ncbi:hypothetical protein BDB01DRAFT_837818 [Pilobolus umbonatus]|nr:hypothetical protein BDB01DRAFT_837818 [Pilobolus umbonatus]
MDLLVTYEYWCIQHMAACFVTDIYTDGNDYPPIAHCTTSEGDTEKTDKRVVGQATTRSRAINDSKTMELSIMTSTNIYTDNDELSHQKEHCYMWIIGDTDQLEPDKRTMREQLKYIAYLLIKCRGEKRNTMSTLKSLPNPSAQVEVALLEQSGPHTNFL